MRLMTHACSVARPTRESDMNWEEWNKLTDEQVKTMPTGEFLRHLIKFTEERYLSYKKLLEELHKEIRTNPPTTDSEKEFIEWYRGLLRDGKNREESTLKELRTEIEYHRQGMNPPWCYPDYKRRNDEA